MFTDPPVIWNGRSLKTSWTILPAMQTQQGGRHNQWDKAPPCPSGRSSDFFCLVLPRSLRLRVDLARAVPPLEAWERAAELCLPAHPPATAPAPPAPSTSSTCPRRLTRLG